MQHEMNLWSQPFSMIQNGEKTIELRLHDEKRQRIRVGDTILFKNADCPEQTLSCRVLALHHFDSFEELYAHLPLLKCGYTASDIASARPEDMDAYYPKEKQAQYCVVGIEIALTDR